MDSPKLPAGVSDPQSVVRGGGRVTPPKIAGVSIVELGNVLTRSGWMMEAFRKDREGTGISPQQVNWVELNPGAVTDWHRHTRQTDHLIGVGGNIRLALWDGRPSSPTSGQSETVLLGAMRPVLVVVPPGVWHGLRNESGRPAGYLNVTDEVYDCEQPDNWRLPPKTAGVPDIL